MADKIENSYIIEKLKTQTCPSCKFSYDWFDVDTAFSDTDLEIIKNKNEVELKIIDKDPKLEKIYKIKKEFYNK